MPRHLVVVESPTKAKTIKRFLGPDFDVSASMGHVRDLPSSTLAVDIEHGFEPEYVVPPEKQATIRNLQAALDEVDELWIATDEDREGEAIGWHLTQVLKRKKDQPIKRIVFHEITESAIKDAAAHPRDIDQSLVDAQQARRVLDRLVGYTLSPFLWKKVYRGLSAGRVQSVAVRIIVDREREILAFIPVEYWTLDAQLETEKQESFTAGLRARDGEKFVPSTQEESDQVLKDLEGSGWQVTNVEEKELKRTPPPPFTTSTLQQEAGRKLGFSVKQTMVVAQQLYEGVNLGKGLGQVGLITYMRTDSVNLSAKALEDAKNTIQHLYGREYILSEPRLFKTKSKNAQEAHEAIRPAEIERSPDSLKDALDTQQLKLYTLIWNRTMATQMAPAELKRVAADITAGRYTFRATGQTVLFDGFLRVYSEGRDESHDDRRGATEDEANDNEKLLPRLSTGQNLTLDQLDPLQHFTKPPPRYTEASLVKKLEEEGIGRPSTYAPTISTVQARGYVEKDGKQLVPTDIAFTVTDLLTEHFPNIADLTFTATMEQLLDDVSTGEKDWRGFLKEFYGPFAALVATKTTEVQRGDVMKDRELGTDPATGLAVLVRTGRFGTYIQLGHLEDMPEIGKVKGKMKREKPKSASLSDNLTKDTVTFDQAMALLSFPKTLGVQEGEPVEVHLGRYGPYIKNGKKTVSVPPDRDPAAIELAEAIDLISRAAEIKKQRELPLRTLGKDPATQADILIKDGRYGPYVTDGVTNCSLPKRFAPDTITLAEALELLVKKRERGPSKWGAKKPIRPAQGKKPAPRKKTAVKKKK